VNRTIMTDWRGQTGWNADRESGAPVLRFTPAARPIDLLVEEGVVHAPKSVVGAIDAPDLSDDVGRYVPTGFEAVLVAEVDAYLHRVGQVDTHFDAGAGLGLFDPALDQFLIGPRPGGFQGNGAFGPEFSELYPSNGAPEDARVSLTTHSEDMADAFIVYPHGEPFALPLADGMDAFAIDGVEITFGGGDDPRWMLTLLPSPDDLIHHTGFGHPGLAIDPWG